VQTCSYLANNIGDLTQTYHAMQIFPSPEIKQHVKTGKARKR